MERTNTRLRPGSWSTDHPNEGDNERWKGSPTTESTGDQGDNARLAHEHARDENMPSAGARRRPSGGASAGKRSRRGDTHH